MYTNSWCPYCERARALLTAKACTFQEIDIEAQPAQRAEMIRRSGRRTVPQIFIGERHIGGSDDIARAGCSRRLWIRCCSSLNSQHALSISKVHSHGQRSPALSATDTATPATHAGAAGRVSEGLLLRGAAGPARQRRVESADLAGSEHQRATARRRPARSGADRHGFGQAGGTDAVPGRGQTGRRVPDAEPVAR